MDVFSCLATADLAERFGNRHDVMSGLPFDFVDPFHRDIFDGGFLRYLISCLL